MTGPTLLLVNKFYHDLGPAGGVGRYVLQEEEDLTAAGWRVVPFAIADAHARRSSWSPFFVKARDYSTPRLSIQAVPDAVSLLWNREAARKLDRLLTQARPTVAHLHNIYHHLTPSILPVLARHRVPVVMTLHDLRLLCPAIHMLQAGQVCERCKGGRFGEAVRGRCVKGSWAASVLAAAETLHQHRRRLYPRHVGTFICPSRFFVGKYTEWGFPREKLTHLPNFVDTERWRPAAFEPRAEYLYFGRLSAEKGLRTLLAAQRMWEDEAEGESLTLVIAGEGPLEAELRSLREQWGLQRVEFLGPLAEPELKKALARCRFTVIPSECYENAPMAALESQAVGRPVVGTRQGGITELINDGQDGILVAPADPGALLSGLKRAAALPSEAGRRARQKVEATMSRPAHMEKLEAILRQAIR
jgi:glycosyltransferase involved in cell wall biosynthesis